MPKLIGPLFSLDAKGTLGKTITFGRNQFGPWVRRIVGRKYTLTSLQERIRFLFKGAVVTWGKISPFEEQLWELVTKGDKKRITHISKDVARWARCWYYHYFLVDTPIECKRNACPPMLNYTPGEPKVYNYDQVRQDVETLIDMTVPYLPVLKFTEDLGNEYPPDYPYPHNGIAGICTLAGGLIMLNEPHFDGLDDWHKTELVAHEMTHAALLQHGFMVRGNVVTHECIAHACGIRVADNVLTPVYKYQGKTLREIASEGTGFLVLNVYPSKRFVPQGETVQITARIKNRTGEEKKVWVKIVGSNLDPDMPEKANPIEAQKHYCSFPIGVQHDITFAADEEKDITIGISTANWEKVWYDIDVQVWEEEFLPWWEAELTEFEERYNFKVVEP